ncbi:PREDICTED: antimicrobial peptide THP2-like [Lepidothrix coronata]|uniref:Antimicrobial peptide THP2-like n=1 Tax=Lepidothrix coronata TaxID=321398 RepID=A0A6J0JAV5_9PASS|nr:PREDICTED: antimicrobial peptide THP2-like [Lepidothrix coronata]
MKILYLLFSLLFLTLQVSPGLSSPRREMFLCRKGTCHFGRCPIHLVRDGSCFGFRSCCKWPWDVQRFSEPNIEEQ